MHYYDKMNRKINEAFYLNLVLFQACYKTECIQPGGQWYGGILYNEEFFILKSHVQALPGTTNMNQRMGQEKIKEHKYF